MLRYSLLTRPSIRLFSTQSADSTTTTSNTTPTTHKVPFDPYCDPANPKKLSFTQISSAAFNIREGILKTECRRSFNFSELLGSDVFFKMECNQVGFFFEFL